ncbi:hypothetical protein SAMN05444336_102250 [Albimonas donghaensis]|uniref:Uncharacterized protein n=1 Tax=Albimonas donghaensis TaxID=356660 RepID=A0A1H2W2Y7_9RHOB|nr:hypothetical protein [Albimonas donghaensis]SDW74911.1 hypothetical protein SAMN05444336_102250 [Albimonas donghaensis]
MSELAAPLMPLALLAAAAIGVPVVQALLVIAALGAAAVFGDNFVQLTHRAVETSASAYALTAAAPFALMGALMARTAPAAGPVGALRAAAPPMALTVVVASASGSAGVGAGTPALVAALAAPVAILALALLVVARVSGGGGVGGGRVDWPWTAIWGGTLALLLSGLAAPAETGALGALAAVGLTLWRGRAQAPAAPLIEAAQATSVLLLTLCAALFFAGVFVAGGGGGLAEAVAAPVGGPAALGLALAAALSLAVGRAAAAVICVAIFAPLVRAGGGEAAGFAALVLIAAQAGPLVAGRRPVAALAALGAMAAVVAAGALAPGLTDGAPALIAGF